VWAEIASGGWQDRAAKIPLPTRHRQMEAGAAGVEGPRRRSNGGEEGDVEGGR
jgi:hypothetical protein